MYPENTMSQYYLRSISEDGPSMLSRTDILRRTMSVPSSPRITVADGPSVLFSNGIQQRAILPTITAPLMNACAVLKEFIHKYVQVWDLDLSIGVSPQTSNALQLLPEQSHLVNNNPVLSISNLRLVSNLFGQMKNALPNTINPKCYNTALTQHGQTLDLLNRAEKSVNDAILFMSVHSSQTGSRDSQAVPIIRSARQILGTAVILIDYFDKVI